MNLIKPIKLKIDLYLRSFFTFYKFDFDRFLVLEGSCRKGNPG